MKKKFLVPIALSIALSGCAGLKPMEDPKKAQYLANSPIGCYARQLGTRGGVSYAEVTVKNNSGKLFNTVYIEILAYNGDNRVGMGNKIFNSVNPNETMVDTVSIVTNNRSWDRWQCNFKSY